LETLPEKEILSGFAEMLKHGLIADEMYWEELIKIRHTSQITASELIKKSIKIKRAICNIDKYDMGERKKLNFGHTIGHALETFALRTGRSLTHGESVALGMMAEAHISYQKKLISEGALILITDALSRFFTPFPIEDEDFNDILSFLYKDKKKINNNLNFTLLDGIGSAVVDQDVNQDVNHNEIRKSIEYLTEIKASKYDTI
jgi:3-dehydroquinate synthase